MPFIEMKYGALAGEGEVIVEGSYLDSLVKAAFDGWDAVTLEELDQLAEWHEEARIRAAIRRWEAI